MTIQSGSTTRRLARTFSGARWQEYSALLERARSAGYRILPLEEWVLNPASAGPTLILRHDVDQHPRSALRMAAIEEQLGVRSTWYFRWRTADPYVIRTLRAKGFEIGFHYETLTRTLLQLGMRTNGLDGLVEQCRLTLRREIATFVALHGPIRSACPHGDTRVPGVNNGVLLRGQAHREFGILFDGNEAMRGRGLRAWLTDRSPSEGGWVDELSPVHLVDAKVTPILCLTHPNNWASGPALWADRLLSLALPAKRPHRPIRTRKDMPPLDDAAG